LDDAVYGAGRGVAQSAQAAVFSRRYDAGDNILAVGDLGVEAALGAQDLTGG
jgi:hypothetical protein